MNLSNPLGRTLITAAQLNRYLSDTPTRESLTDLARNLGLKNPGERSLGEVTSHIHDQVHTATLAHLQLLDQPSPVQKKLLQMVPQLASSNLRLRLRELSHILERSTAIVSDTAIENYAKSGRVVTSATVSERPMQRFSQRSQHSFKKIERTGKQRVSTEGIRCASNCICTERRWSLVFL